MALLQLGQFRTINSMTDSIEFLLLELLIIFLVLLRIPLPFNAVMLEPSMLTNR